MAAAVVIKVRRDPQGLLLLLLLLFRVINPSYQQRQGPPAPPNSAFAPAPDNQAPAPAPSDFSIVKQPQFAPQSVPAPAPASSPKPSPKSVKTTGLSGGARVGIAFLLVVGAVSGVGGSYIYVTRKAERTRRRMSLLRRDHNRRASSPEESRSRATTYSESSAILV